MGYTELSDWVSTLSYDDETAKVGTQYYYKVKAKDSLSESNFSESNKGSLKVIVDTPVLDAPSYVLASDGEYDGKIYINWPYVSGATLYKVYRSTDENLGYTELSDWIRAFSYYDETANAGTQYYYKVKAKDSLSESNFSESNKGSLKVLDEPVAPSYVIASDGKYYDKINVDWPYVSGATLYKVYRSTDENGGYAELSDWIRASSYDDETANAGTQYYYKVKCRNNDLESELSHSNKGNIKTLEKPSSVAASDGSYTSLGIIHINWGYMTGASGYKVYRSISAYGNYTPISDWGSSSYYSDEDTALVSGVTYYYKVKARNKIQESEFSDFSSGSL